MQSLELIDNYFTATLNPEETRQFEQRILNDPAFADEVAFYFNTMSILREKAAEEKKQQFLELYRVHAARSARPAVVRRMFKPWQMAAASLIPLIIAGWYFFSMPASTEQLAEKYIKQELQELPVTMSAANLYLQTGKQLYNEGKYAEALQAFETDIRQNPSAPDPKRFAGIVSLRMEEYDKALIYFRQLGNIHQYSNPGKFYQALTLMKRNQPGDRQEAKKLLDEVATKKLEGHETAVQWLDKW